MGMFSKFMDLVTGRWGAAPAVAAQEPIRQSGPAKRAAFNAHAPRATRAVMDERREAARTVAVKASRPLALYEYHRRLRRETTGDARPLTVNQTRIVLQSLRDEGFLERSGNTTASRWSVVRKRPEQRAA